MAKANYHQIRRQKELARKTRKQEKQQKRQAAKAGEPNALESAEVAIDTAPQSTASANEPVTDSTGSAAVLGAIRS